MHFYNDIKNGNILLEKIEQKWKQFKSKLNKITTGNQKHKLKDQLYAIRNIKNLYNSKDKLIKVYNNITKSIQL